MSSGPLYLQTSNFGINKIPDGPVLCNSIKGFSVVLFYSPSRCQYSPHALAELKSVVGHVNGVVFAVLNIDKYMDVVKMSRNTITSIDGVPYIMLYYNGVPRQIYPENYPYTADAIRSFASTVSSNMAKSMATASQNQAKETPSPKKDDGVKKSIYYIGTPLKRKNCTYISVDTQLTSITQHQQRATRRT